MSIQQVTPGNVAIPTAAPLANTPTPRPAERPRAAEASPAANAARPERRSAKEIEEAIAKVSDFVAKSSNEINISIDKDSGMRIVKVVDTATNEVVRQIPSEEVVAIAQALDKLQGLFLRDKV